MANNRKTISELSFVEVLIGFIFVWVIAALWITFFKNLFYNTMGLDESSTFQTFSIAILITMIFLAVVYISGQKELSSLEKELGTEE